MEFRCRYTRINGARCTMPALDGHDLCFQHQQRKRQARLKPILPEPNTAGPLVSSVYMEDHAAVLANLNAIAEAFARHSIDHRQVETLTYLMQTCLKTLRQMHELEADLKAEDAVRQVVYDDGLALAADPAPAPPVGAAGRAWRRNLGLRSLAGLDRRGFRKNCRGEKTCRRQCRIRVVARVA
jgi:hypothetical protein